MKTQGVDVAAMRPKCASTYEEQLKAPTTSSDSLNRRFSTISIRRVPGNFLFFNKWNPKLQNFLVFRINPDIAATQ